MAPNWQLSFFRNLMSRPKYSLVIFGLKMGHFLLISVHFDINMAFLNWKLAMKGSYEHLELGLLSFLVQFLQPSHLCTSNILKMSIPNS